MILPQDGAGGQSMCKLWQKQRSGSRYNVMIELNTSRDEEWLGGRWCYGMVYESRGLPSGSSSNTVSPGSHTGRV